MKKNKYFYIQSGYDGGIHLSNGSVIGTINKEYKKYGISTELEKECKQWRTDFFASDTKLWGKPEHEQKGLIIAIKLKLELGNEVNVEYRQELPEEVLNHLSNNMITYEILEDGTPQIIENEEALSFLSVDITKNINIEQIRENIKCKGCSGPATLGR